MHHRRDAVPQHAGEHPCRLRPDAGVAGGERREPQQHEPPGHLTLDLGAAARRVRADQGLLGWARISVGMCRVASAPKPVEIP